MAKNTCKLCSRRFASPRALAGHMRSHSVKVAARAQQISSASSASTSFAAGDDDADAKMAIQAYVLRDKPKRRVRLAESDFSDRESEAEYPAPDAKRVHAGSRDAEPVSSVSDAATPEEDVALSLMMLSRDSWPTVAWPRPSYFYHDAGEAAPPAAAEQKRTRFQCPACKKVFRSYQALGGHRASHVRGGRGGCCAPPPNPPPPPAPTHLQPLVECEEGSKPPPPHECPYCFRVFTSGQALGSHKRSQLCTAAGVADPAAAIKSLGLIDLNLPAPFEDLEVSAVSDPFLSARPGY
ncbi:zinc finger protein ZAT1-like [Hordeum vulgare subsp. vulgare]|uniref:C2H2-type domain-containing protein n=1 Tax=Hordeum vulgare subsp. vulgare TaxID=112509 RepID=A0A8I6XFU8_HORVV|nr:zinc finger protein ZAT1-like [Hordeum vulgare subsp. vulgare]KAI5011516.1 hypothetical protein ZWY2020_013653 [Hordeum vulgare]